MKSEQEIPKKTITPSHLRQTLVVASVLALLTGCQTQTPATKQSNLPKLSHQVAAASYPLAYFAEQLTGDSIEVLAITPAAKAGESWRPSQAETLSMQESDIIFVNGSAAPFATWLPHVTLPDSKICATANDGLKLSDMIAVEDIRIVHSHGPEGEHSHPTMVAYSWLDPNMSAKQVAIMTERLIATYPDSKPSIQQSALKLTEALEELAPQFADISQHATEPPIVLTSSPDLKFLTRAAGLNDIHLNWREPPSPAEAKAQLEAKLSTLEQSPKFMLFPAEPTPDLRSVAESFDLETIVLDPMRFAPPEGDYFSVMSANLKKLEPVAEQN